jgi:hypothetical protein
LLSEEEVGGGGRVTYAPQTHLPVHINVNHFTVKDRETVCASLFPTFPNVITDTALTHK